MELWTLKAQLDIVAAFKHYIFFIYLRTIFAIVFSVFYMQKEVKPRF